MLSPDDPAGAQPRRDHRFLDRVSRHAVPKTPGKDDAFKVYDPARVSHIPVSQSVRHPSGVAGLGVSRFLLFYPGWYASLPGCHTADALAVGCTP